MPLIQWIMQDLQAAPAPETIQFQLFATVTAFAAPVANVVRFDKVCGTVAAYGIVDAAVEGFGALVAYVSPYGALSGTIVREDDPS